MIDAVPDEKEPLGGIVKSSLFVPGATQDLPPLAVHASTANSQKDLTIRQVAPLVLILSGAAFLNVSFPLTILSKPSLKALDSFNTIRGHSAAKHHGRSQYSRDSAAMDRLGILFDIGFSSSLSRKIGRCVWETMAFHSRVVLACCDDTGCSILPG